MSPSPPPRPELGRILFTEHEIQRRVIELGREISAHYRATPIVVVGVLKGAVFFLADLIRHIESPLVYDFYQVSSYRSATAPQGEPEISLSPGGTFAGRDVLLVEDIVDTGHTLALLQAAIRREEPKSLRTVVFLDKRERRQRPVDLDWVGFTIPNRFVVGYGMDFDQRYRNLPYLAVLDEPWS